MPSMGRILKSSNFVLPGAIFRTVIPILLLLPRLSLSAGAIEVKQTGRIVLFQETTTFYDRYFSIRYDG